MLLQGLVAEFRESDSGDRGGWLEGEIGQISGLVRDLATERE